MTGPALHAGVALVLGAATLAGCTTSGPPASTATSAPSSPTLPANASQVGTCLELSATAFPDSVHLRLPEGFHPSYHREQHAVFVDKDAATFNQLLVGIQQPYTEDRSPAALLDRTWLALGNGRIDHPGQPSPWPGVAGGSMATSPPRLGDDLPPNRTDWYVVPTANTTFVVTVSGPATDPALAAIGSSIATGPCPG